MPFILIRGGSADIRCNENMLNILYWIARSEFFPVHCITATDAQSLPLGSVWSKTFGLNKWERSQTSDMLAALAPMLPIQTFQLPPQQSLLSPNFPSTKCCHWCNNRNIWPEIGHFRWYGFKWKLNVNEFCISLLITSRRIPKDLGD